MKILEDYEKGITIDEYGDTIQCDLAYSNVEPPKKIQHIGVGISHVRASDGIKICYDYDRDGYVIKQCWTEEVDKGSFIEEVQHWEETAFVQSWALEEKNKKLTQP